MSTRIAVVDDDPAVLTLLHELLSEEGYEPYLFSDGATACPCLHDSAPAAIILDIRLPSTEAGWAMLARLRHDLVLYTVPVIVCSADLPA